MLHQPLPPCPICKSASAPAFAAAEHRFYRCLKCRTAFVHPVPGAEQLEQFYARFHLDDAAGGMYDAFEARMQADFAAKLQVVRRATRGNVGRLLDVGCGKGFFVKLCADQGVDATGVDLSSTAVAYATGTLGVRAVQGDLKAVQPSLGTVDTVTFWATIEHLPDPVETLRDIFRVLRPGGTLLVDTGIGDDWLDRLLPGVVQWYDPPQHLFVFSADGLTRALEAAGFRDVRLDRCFERTALRKVVRVARAAVLAGGLRAVSAVTRARAGPFEFTRYPVGNLMMASAVKPAT